MEGLNYYVRDVTVNLFQFKFYMKFVHFINIKRIFMKRVGRYLILCIFSLTILNTSSVYAAETNDIKGYIKDSSSGEVLPYANIVLIGHDRGTTTNTDGYFILVNAPIGELEILISYIGYESKTVQVNNLSNSKEVLQIEMISKDLSVSGVEVVAEAYEIFKSSDRISQLTLSPRALQVLPTLGEVDIFRSLQLLPGISGIGDGTAGLYVRGGTPDQNMVILDGMIVYHVDHLFGMFSAFNAEAIKDVQMYKGGYPAKYGGRLSSVVELTGKRGGDTRQFSFGANLLSANFSLETPILNKSGNWLISARRSYTDLIQSAQYNSIFEFISGEETVTNQPNQFGGGGRGGAFQQEIIPSFYFFDLNSKLSLNPTNKDLVTFSFYAGRDYLDKSRDLQIEGGFRNIGGAEFDTRVDENLTDWGNIAGSFRWGHQLSDRLFSNILISNSMYTSIYERDLSFSGSNTIGIDDSTGSARGLGTFAQDEDNKVNDLTLRFDNQWQLHENHKLEIGSFLSDVQTDYTATIRDTINILDIHSKSRTSGFYAQDEWKIHRRLNLTLGFRSTYHDQTNRFYNTPRLSFGMRITGNLKFKGAWGQYNQFINNVENENVLQGSNDFWLSADENIAPGVSEHSILGLTYENRNYLFEVEGYYKTMENLLEFSRRFQNDSDYLNYFFFGSGISKGVEFLAQKKFGMTTGWLSYTLGNVEHTFPKLNNGESFPASHDRTHELKLVGSRKFGPWTLSSTWMYATGNAYTAPESQYFLEMLDGEQLSYIHVGEKNTYRLPDYQRLDLSLSRKFESEKFVWNTGLSIYNVFNQYNVSYRDYDLDVSPIIVSDVLMLGFIPTLSIKVTLR